MVEDFKRSFNIRNRNLRKENRMSRKIGLALMVAAGLPVCAARAAEVSSGAEFAAALAETKVLLLIKISALRKLT